jgi:hypothetical protein
VYFNQDQEIEETTETKLSFAGLLGYQLKYVNFSCAFKLKYYLMSGGYNTFQAGILFNYSL